MKKRLLILMTVTGMIILLGGLLTYGLGVHEIIPVPRPDLIVVGTSLIGILLIVSGVCDLFVKKTKEMEIEENDERNISLSNAAMASGFKVMNVTIAVSIFALIFTGYMTVVPCFTIIGAYAIGQIYICITKISTFLILCDLAVCLATLYVSFSLVFALMRYLQGKVFLIRFYSPTTLSSSRAEFRLPSRLACA